MASARGQRNGAGELRTLLDTPLLLNRHGVSAALPKAGTDRRVFISYASRDYLTATKVCDQLESQGIACWIAPRDIPPGEEFPLAIVSAIESCACMVVVLSSAANASPHVKREVERALHRKRTLLPLRMEEVEPAGSLEYLLGSIHWIDGFGELLSHAVATLSTRIGALHSEVK